MGSDETLAPGRATMVVMDGRYLVGILVGGALVLVIGFQLLSLLTN